MKRHNKKNTASIINRRARYDYELGDELVVGMILSGQEVRAARDGHVHLRGAFISLRDGELWLHNASFSVKTNDPRAKEARTVDMSSRKLLAHKKQISALADSKQSGTTIVPIKMLTGGRFIKLVIAPGKGKKRYDKRETLKRRTQERDIKRAISSY